MLTGGLYVDPGAARKGVMASGLACLSVLPTVNLTAALVQITVDRLLFLADGALA